VEPRPERPAPVEALQRPDRRDERLLGDVLGRRSVVDDQIRGSVGAPPVAAKELLQRFLGAALRGTSPTRRAWGETVRQGKEQGLFEESIGSVTAIRPGPAGLSVDFQPYQSDDILTLDATGIVCSTGFVKSAFSLPLLRRLVQTYGVPVQRERVVLKTNCGVPPLDRDDSRLCMMGLNANTVVPNGDTIAGLKYIARRFVGDAARAEGIRARRFPSRLAMQVGLARRTVRALRHVRKTEQLA
jgi:hypothetical protein